MKKAVIEIIRIIIIFTIYLVAFNMTSKYIGFEATVLMALALIYATQK